MNNIVRSGCVATAQAAARVSALVALGCALSLATAADTAADFEPPVDQAPAQLLPAALASGADFHVVDPVQSDGLMHRYVVDSKYGRFDAYGRVSLANRVHEVAALSELAKTSTVAVVAGGVGRGVQTEVKTAVGVVTHPVKTVVGIPKGIAHLFHGYVDEGKEAAAEASSSTDSAGTPGSVAKKSESAATQYAAHYVGLTSAERHWYQKLGVDPYTDNSVLRKEIHRNAEVDAAAGFSVRFVGIPSIPGIGDVNEVMDAVYTEEPATLRKRNKATLAGYGLQPDEIKRLQHSLVLSPTRQALLLKAAAALNGVDGRGELFRHALGLTSDAEAQVYLQSVGLLVLAHGKQPLAAILPGVRLPSARRSDGHIVVCGAFESVYWTADVARSEAQLRQALPQADAGTRELWLAGVASDRARTELRDRGWELHEGLQDQPAVTASR